MILIYKLFKNNTDCSCLTPDREEIHFVLWDHPDCHQKQRSLNKQNAFMCSDIFVLLLVESCTKCQFHMPILIIHLAYANYPAFSVQIWSAANTISHQHMTVPSRTLTVVSFDGERTRWPSDKLNNVGKLQQTSGGSAYACWAVEAPMRVHIFSSNSTFYSLNRTSIIYIPKVSHLLAYEDILSTFNKPKEDWFFFYHIY